MNKYKAAIINSKLSIYDSVPKELYIPTKILEKILSKNMVGISLKEYEHKVKSRSKRIKQLVSKSLGYPVPSSFKKTKADLPGQQLDTFGQEKNNLQMWNDDIVSERRYAIFDIRKEDNSKIETVKVVTGEEILKLLKGKKPKSTIKYQATIKFKHDGAKLLSSDTKELKEFVNDKSNNPTMSLKEAPSSKNLMSIEMIFSKVKKIIGEKISNNPILGRQGFEVQKLIAKVLGYNDNKEDNGQFPDIPNQLLEVKTLKESTIDFGLYSPANNSTIYQFPKIDNYTPKVFDCRYVIVHITHQKITDLYLVNGKHFFDSDSIKKINGLNSKIQIILSNDFFDSSK